MFDDLRHEASDEAGFEAEEKEKEDIYSLREKVVKPKPILGMNSVQRFIIAVMILLMALLLSSFCLIMSGKVWLPF